MDRGYDSGDIHRLIRDYLNSCCLIPAGTENGSVSPDIIDGEW